jgi:hypothetical protein
MAKAGGKRFVLAMCVGKAAQGPVGELAVIGVTTQISEPHEEGGDAGILRQHGDGHLQAGRASLADVEKAFSGAAMPLHNSRAKLHGAFEIEWLSQQRIGVQHGQAGHGGIHEQPRDVWFPVPVVIHFACRCPQGLPEVLEDLLSPVAAVVPPQKPPRLKIGRGGSGIGVTVDILIEQR